MDNYAAAVGRDVGKVNTDSNGLARYSLKLQLPPGIRPSNEPELSLEYCQGTPNGYLGVGRALGGISAIRQAPANLVFDGINPLPAEYDRLKPKLTLDGAEMHNIAGAYGAPDAQYTIEVEGVRRIVTQLELGYVVCDSAGSRFEYGTTDDSRVLAND
ncbi:hypothetical protein ACHAPE_002901 [Trichoderma viride]